MMTLPIVVKTIAKIAHEIISLKKIIKKIQKFSLCVDTEKSVKYIY